MKKKIKLLIKILFIFAAFYIIFQKVDINELKNIKLHNPLFLFLAFIFYNASQIISTLRIHIYLKNINVTPSFKKQLMLYYVGMFYSTILPGGIGGEVYKAYKFQKKYKKGYKKIIKALLIDRISGLFAIMFLIGIIIFISSFRQFVWVIGFLIVIAPFGLYFLHKTLFLEFDFYPFLYSVIIQLLQGLSFLAILLSLGIKEHLIDLIILFFISSIISAIPISIGGVGLRELTFLYGLEYLHLNPATGVVAAFLFFVISLISSAIGILFLKGVEDV